MLRGGLTGAPTAKPHCRSHWSRGGTLSELHRFLLFLMIRRRRSAFNILTVPIFIVTTSFLNTLNNLRNFPAVAVLLCNWMTTCSSNPPENWLRSATVNITSPSGPPQMRAPAPESACPWLRNGFVSPSITTCATRMSSTSQTRPRPRKWVRLVKHASSDRTVTSGYPAIIVPKGAFS